MSTLSWRRSRRFWGRVGLLTLLGSMGALGQGPAPVAAAKPGQDSPLPADFSTLPDLKLPFACGQQWRLSTYGPRFGVGGHPIPDRQIDFFRVDGGIERGVATSAGWPVLAAAAGVVHETYGPGGVEIDHGGRWFTQYLHMTNILVATGDYVYQGQQIGLVGAVDVEDAHLHFELMYDYNLDGDGDGPGKGAGDDAIYEDQYPVLEGRTFVLSVDGDDANDPRVFSTNTCPGGGGPQGTVQYGSDLNVFSRETGTNDLVLERYGYGGWTRQTFPASLSGQPAATVYRDQLQVVARETSGVLRRWWKDPYHAWQTTTLPGTANGDPDIATLPGTDQLQIVARDGSDRLRQWWWDGRTWNNNAIPLSSDVAIAGVPALSIYSVDSEWVQPIHPGIFQVVARATDGRLWMWAYGRSGWAREQLPATASGDPSVAVYNGQLHVVFKGTDNKLRHLWRTTYNPWSSEVLSNTTPLSTSSIVLRDNQFHVVTRMTGSVLSHLWYDGTWHSDQPPGAVAAAPDVTVYSDPGLTGWHWGQLQIAARRTDGRLWTWWAGPGEAWGSAVRVSSVDGPWWVDTFGSAPGRSTPGGTQTGTLYSGTNYVYCKVWGPNVQVGSAYNHWWLLTDLDAGSPWQNQWVSAYYLSRWGNDEAKDNNGVEIPGC
jgi:peptidase M23-like protein